MKAYTLFFSPTQTGATVAGTVRNALRMDVGGSFDITKAAIEKPFGADDIVVIAMPVYGGRLPALAVERFQAVRGNGAKAVAIVVYGNAKVGDALLELTDLCVDHEFQVIAAATFIGEHSFTTNEFPLAVGRPDATDRKNAADFSALIQERLDAPGSLATPSVPGNRPYKDAMNPPPLAATGFDPELCTRCGLCETFCPSGAITMAETGPQTDGTKCIWCCACVKTCPGHARKIVLPKIRETAERLYANFQERQKPQWFLAE